MPPKRPPDRDEDAQDAPPPKNPSIARPQLDTEQIQNDLLALKEAASLPNADLLRSIVSMVSLCLETINELRQEIRNLKNERPAPPISQPPPAPHPLPARPNAWINPYPKQKPMTTPHPPPKNVKINKFKAATLIIHKTPGSEPFKGMKSAEIVLRINNALSSVNATVNGSPVKIRGASILPSGDVLMNMDNRLMKNWLLDNKHTWTKLAHSEFITAQTRYPVLFNFAPADLDVDNADFPQKISIENDIPIEMIHSVKWLKHPNDTGKKHGTIILSLLDKDLAHKLEKGGLYADCNRLKSKHYVQGPTMCFNCLDLNHTHSSCNSTPFCAKCGNPHNTKDCANNDSEQVCARCFHYESQKTKDKLDRFSSKFNHSPKSLGCPLRNTKYSISPLSTNENEL